MENRQSDLLSRILVVFLLSLGFLTIWGACGLPPVSSSLEPPTTVMALRSGANIIVSWSSVEQAEQYQVYRKQGSGDFVPVSTDVDDPEYTDSSFPKDRTICYAIRSVAGDEFSVLSDPSNLISVWVQNVEATCLAYSDRIALSWDVHPELPDSYTVYRYLSKSSATPEKTISGILANSYDDINVAVTNPLVKENPYYYKVTWTKGGIEYGTDSPLAFGIFGDRIDINEPNAEVDDAITLGLNNAPVFSCIYSFGDGDGGTDTDTDWYHYQGPAGTAFFVKVSVLTDPDARDFISNELYFRFYYNDDFVGVTAQPVNVSIQNSFIFDDFQGLTDDVDVYFKLETNVDSAKQVIDSYEIVVEDEM